MNRKKRKAIINFENNTDEVFIDSNIEDEDSTESIQEFEEEKIETCKVIFIKDKSFVIDFKGYGINIKTHGLIDKDLIHPYVDVKYMGEVGNEDFEYHLIFE